MVAIEVIATTAVSLGTSPVTVPKTGMIEEEEADVAPHHLAVVVGVDPGAEAVGLPRHDAAVEAGAEEEVAVGTAALAEDLHPPVVAHPLAAHPNAAHPHAAHHHAAHRHAARVLAPDLVRAGSLWWRVTVMWECSHQMRLVRTPRCCCKLSAHQHLFSFCWASA